jgi:hypothetical protein
MLELFVIGDETTHVTGGTDWPATRCDHCGRSKEELD